jgi:hypothetical protein
MSNRLKFVKGEWYRNTRFKDLVCRIIKPITTHTFQVELYTIGYGKTPRTLGVFTTYFIKGDGEWEIYDNEMPELQ